MDVACRMDVPVPEADHTFDLPCDRNPFHGGIGKSVKRLKQILRDGHYDLLVCSTVVGSIVARMAADSFRKDGLKVIYMCHGLHFFPGASPSRWAMGYPMEKLLAPKTDVIIITNDADLASAKKYLHIPIVEKSHSMGVNLRRFREAALSETERIAQRKKLGLGAEDYVLIYVAEIIANKNQIMLLEAFELVRKIVPHAKLVLVGPEHDDGLLRKTVESKGLQQEVLLLGWRSDIPVLLHLADVYVASSKSEGLGLNLIEAMACDLPVIATKSRGHTESIIHGQTGFLVEINDSKAMANYVLQLYGDPQCKERFTRQAQFDIKKFGTEEAIEELVEMVIRHG